MNIACFIVFVVLVMVPAVQVAAVDVYTAEEFKRVLSDTTARDTIYLRKGT
jgi:hypothetical protein